MSCGFCTCSDDDAAFASFIAGSLCFNPREPCEEIILLLLFALLKLLLNQNCVAMRLTARSRRPYDAARLSEWL